MLRLALLGYDPSVHDLARAALVADGFGLVALCLEEDQAAIPPDLAAARRERHWEWLLHDNTVDAVIVARDAIPSREDALRKLVQAGKPLLLTFPPCEAIFALELEMIRRDGGGPIVTFVPQRLHPLAERFAAVGEELGEVELITIARRLPDCLRPQVREAFAADVAFLRQMLGRLSQISATGAAPQSAAEPNLAIAVQSETGGVGRWSVEPAGHAGAVVTVRGSAGKTQLTIGAKPDAWSLELPSGEVIAAESAMSEQQLAIKSLEELAAAVEGQMPSAAWEQVCRELEVADMIDHSLRRQRTIELYDDEVSERGTFKGMMAAGGCFLLLLALFVLLIVSVVEGLQAPFRNHFLWRLWPAYLLAPIVIFLVMQLLQLAIRKPADTDDKQI